MLSGAHNARKLRRERMLPLIAVLVIGLPIWGLGGAGCGGRSEPAEPSPVSGGNDPAPVLRILEQWRQAYDVRSVDELAKVYADNKTLVVVHQGKTNIGWDSVRGMLGDRLAQAKEIHMRITESSVDVRGETAMLVARLTREFSDGVTSVSEAGTLTMTLIVIGGQWRIAAEHFSYGVR